MQAYRKDTIVDSLLTALPEAKNRYETLQDDIGPDVLPYMIVGLVLKPVVEDALRSDADDALLQRSFAFLEEMARSQDVEVVNLLHVGVFETWVGKPEILATAWKYMGESTKDLAREVAHRLRCGDNLPYC